MRRRHRGEGKGRLEIQYDLLIKRTADSSSLLNSFVYAEAVVVMKKRVVWKFSTTNRSRALRQQ
jgi:hypothetical protein